MKFIVIKTVYIALSAATNVVDAAVYDGSTPLRVEAAKKGILIGSGAINPSYLDEPQFASVLRQQFNSLSPENELKWSFINPAVGQYNWQTIDRLVTFAQANGMMVKGHGLISKCCNPDYLNNITEPHAFRTAMANHFNAVMHRYRGKLDRWDVVTEALITMGGGLDPDVLFFKVLGPGYIADAFRAARAADPKARLFINENLVESLPGKRQELYDLVAGLVMQGVPIDGVALQMHITEVAPPQGAIREIFNAYKGLGLEVSVAEMDVHSLNNTLVTEIYGSVMKEILEAGITDISFWGFTDKHAYTWIEGAKPLMFDENYQPKEAFFAVQTVLANFVNSPSELS
ncbi:glycoside hydrolase [Thozetella sp. PMI_491]|nr:glycoside hydrolase [Thozetella sp. PMI_491]